MNFHVLTLFPDMIRSVMGESIIGRAVNGGLIHVNAVDIRAYTESKHKKVDDYPYGGGAGMLMQAQPIYDAYRAIAADIQAKTIAAKPSRFIYLTPQGRPFKQDLAKELAGESDLILLCGHYEGVDERVLEEIGGDHISIGDYVLTGGELAAMVVIDAVARLLPGVLSNAESGETESLSGHLLEYPQYTRPEVWRGRVVPEVLLSGHHAKVAEWRKNAAIERTAKQRPDLYEQWASP